MAFAIAQLGVKAFEQNGQHFSVEFEAREEAPAKASSPPIVKTDDALALAMDPDRLARLSNPAE